MEDEELIYQTRDEMPIPTNPLQALRESFTHTSRDVGETKFDAWAYSVIVGWDDGSYEELKRRFSWSDEQIEYQKMLHRNFNKAWNLFMYDLNSNK